MAKKLMMIIDHDSRSRSINNTERESEDSSHYMDRLSFFNTDVINVQWLINEQNKKGINKFFFWTKKKFGTPLSSWRWSWIIFFFDFDFTREKLIDWLTEMKYYHVPNFFLFVFDTQKKQNSRHATTKKKITLTRHMHRISVYMKIEFRTIIFVG